MQIQSHEIKTELKFSKANVELSKLSSSKKSMKSNGTDPKWQLIC